LVRAIALGGAAALAVEALACRSAVAQLPAYGVTGAHDPSTLLQVGDSYMYFCTGQGILSRVSPDMEHWIAGPAVFSTPPAWTETAVPGFTGDFWAPDVSYFDGIYHLYYAVSTFGSQISAIGMATNTTLNYLDYASYDWVDQGPVIQSTTGSLYNTIDPSILVDTNGSVYMSFGSYWNGIYITQLNPSTGKLLNSNQPTQIADNSQIEASYLYHQGNYYYLFVNFGMCCMGVDSTYNIRVGRSTSVGGPYVDENGVPMTQGGGTLLLGSEGRYIGPGQVGIMPEGNDFWMSYHYYDGDNDGTPTYALQQLYWNNQAWPTLTAPAPESITWNNTGGRGDGVSWDIEASQNWNSAGTPSTYVDGDSVTLNDTNDGHYAITLNTAISPGSVTINNNSGNYSISGAGGIGGAGSLAKLGVDTATLSTVNTYSGGTSVSAGTLLVGVNGALPNGKVAITGGTLKLGANTGLAQMTSLSIAGSGALDVNNNHVIISYGATDPVSQIAGYLATGYAGGTWTGDGINSSAAAANSAYALGYADGADGVVAGLSSGQIEIQYTLYGDANLDGVVNGSDFGILAAHFGQQVSGWDKGDFNYDGVVNGSDFGALAANFGQQTSGAAVVLPASDYAALDAFAAANGLLADVPEPASAGVFGAMGLAVFQRRRRNSAGNSSS
jgi:autotransporter-associated beta strand protein